MVQTVTHRRHVRPDKEPTSAVSQANTGSPADEHHRISQLVLDSIPLLKNVRTLRIINGYLLLTRALVRGFLDPSRQCGMPLRRLWIEDIPMTGLQWPVEQPFAGGLHSLRIRRTNLLTDADERSISDLNALPELGQRLDLEPVGADMSAAEPIQCHLHSRTLVRNLLRASADTLTSLTFDWIFGLTRAMDSFWAGLPIFPHLRALQLRSDVSELEDVPDEYSLFEHGSVFFEFISQHPNLQCLAWPMESFFASGRPQCSYEEEELVQSVMLNLAKRLKVLRVDACMMEGGEPQTDNPNTHSASLVRIRRRKFVRIFAPETRALEVLKIEGGIPKDETRELVLAAGHCPLKKLVIIGISWPLGSCIPRPPGIVTQFGYVSDTDPVHEMPDDTPAHSSAQQCQRQSAANSFVPIYGMRNMTVLHVIATHFSDTMEELKFIGSDGAPDIYDAGHMRMAGQVLQPLQQLHRLGTLSISLNLDTTFEGELQDGPLARFWRDAQTPASTAVAVARDAEPASGWGRLLQTRFAPDLVARQAVRVVEPQLAPTRPAGRALELRALFMLRAGEERFDAYGIFDLAIGVGPDGGIVWTRGPRSDSDLGKLLDKLEARGWF